MGYFYSCMIFSARNTVLLIILIAIAVFVESSVPYLCAERNAPAGYSFSGQVAYSADQNMYFSFISQARDGAFVLKNKLTSIHNEPVFVNLEYWMVGTIQRYLGLSENEVYTIWRFLGVVLLAIGFRMLARATLDSEKKRLVAFALFFCTGGFGFVFAALNGAHLLSADALQAGIIDARYGMLPLQQIISNPHFSMPHGLLLIAYSLFLMAERAGKTKYYVYSGLVFALIGLVRPYDLLPPFLIFPLYVLAADGFKFRFGQLVQRMLPLLLILPVLGYNLWLFKFNDIFKYWSLQGHNAGSLPGPLWHYMAYGIAGILAAARLLQLKKHPMGKTGTFLLLWFGITFVFIQMGRFLPVIGWSPQIGVYLAAPLALAASTLRMDELIPAKRLRTMLVAAIVAVVAISNLFVVFYHTRKFTGAVETEVFYTANTEMEAYKWLRANTVPGTVVLADILSSQRIAKYTSNAVVAAHYSVTPRFGDFKMAVKEMLADTMILSGQQPLRADGNVSYLYLKKGVNPTPVPAGTHLQEVYANSGVLIYKTLP